MRSRVSTLRTSSRRATWGLGAARSLRSPAGRGAASTWRVEVVGGGTLIWSVSPLAWEAAEVICALAWTEIAAEGSMCERQDRQKAESPVGLPQLGHILRSCSITTLLLPWASPHLS